MTRQSERTPFRRAIKKVIPYLCVATAATIKNEWLAMLFVALCFLHLLGDEIGKDSK